MGHEIPTLLALADLVVEVAPTQARQVERVQLGKAMMAVLVLTAAPTILAAVAAVQAQSGKHRLLVVKSVMVATARQLLTA